METVLWFLLLFICLFSFILILYFYLAHDDLKRGKLTAYQLTETLGFYVPIEMICHLLITMACFCHENYFLFIYNLPLTLLNIRDMLSKRFIFHAFLKEDYIKMIQNERFFLCKMLFYIFLMIAMLYQFMNAFSNMMIYRLYG